MKIELLNGFTRVNPQDTANEFSLEGRKRRGRQAMQKIKGRKKMRLRQAQNPTRQAVQKTRERAVERNNPQRMSKSRVNAMAERRARSSSRRLTPQQQVINSYNVDGYTLNGGDANYFLKDNAIYSDAQLEQMNFPAGLVAGAIANKLGKGKGKKKRSKGIPRADRKAQRKQARADKRADRRQEREDRKQRRVDDRQDARRTRRTDRQEAQRLRQEQRQANKLARQQARQDRKLAQTQARQQDNIIKAEARAGAVESGDTFGQRAGGLFSNLGEGAKNLVSNNPQLRAGIFENIEDITGVDLGQPNTTGRGFEDDQYTFDDNIPEQSFLEKYKIPLLVGGGLIGAYYLTKKKK